MRDFARNEGDEIFERDGWHRTPSGWELRFVDDEMPYIVLVASARFGGNSRSLGSDAWTVEVTTGSKLDTCFSSRDVDHLYSFVYGFFGDVIRRTSV